MTTQNFTQEQFSEYITSAIANGQINEDEARQLIEKYKFDQREKGGLISAVWEPTYAIGGSLAGTVAGGFSGLTNLALGRGSEEAAEAVEGTQEFFAEATAPETQTGINALENVGQVMELGIDLARIPISGLGGLAALFTGKSPEYAAKIVNDIQEKGLSQTIGDETYAKTGSPLMATTAYMAPEVLLAAIPAVGKAVKVDNFKKETALRIKDANANPELSRTITGIQQNLDSGNTGALVTQLDNTIRVSPPRIQKQLTEVAEDVTLGVDEKTISKELAKIADDAATPAAERELADYIATGTGRVKTDPFAKEAVKQGFDQGVIAAVKSASPADQKYMMQMVDLRERLSKISTVVDRPTDIAGNNLVKRVNYVKQVNRDASKQLDSVAETLKGQQVDFSAPVDNFIARLEGKLNVKIDRTNNNPVYVGSDIEGLEGPINVINRVINRMKSGTAGDMPDAYDIHRLKKFIDEQVTYGKTAEGLSGTTAGILKSLRKELDEVLDSNFDEYNRVNTTYADTVTALDDLQTAVGGKIDIFGDNADKSLGTVLRGLMSNNRGRIQLMDSVNSLESMARKYGAEFDDNIRVQMLFADELDSVFGTTARTSLEGSQRKGTAAAIADVATGETNTRNILAQAVTKFADKTRNINAENAYKAIRKVLEQ